MSPELLKAAQTRRDEGEPCNWIAEDLGVTPSQVRQNTTPPADADREWKSAWSQIQRHKHLLDLHREFAPRGQARS